jgi:hypothetical protein
MNSRTHFLNVSPQIKEEVIRLQNQLGAAPGVKVRAVTEVARSLLLAGRYGYDGRYCDPVAKSLGAGVYEIWLKEE